MVDQAGLAVEEASRRADLAAERLDDGLVTEADAECRRRRSETADHVERGARLLRPAGARRDHEVRRAHRLGLVRRNLVVSPHHDGATPLLQATAHQILDVTDPESEAAGVRWWMELTERGGEGMVVKPLDFVARGRRGPVQPAVKCRGREYLRIIYGPEYTAPEHLERLRARRLFAKRSLALREFALGIEALERFVRREPLRRVHECVFGVLALESEPVDPRL